MKIDYRELKERVRIVELLKDLGWVNNKGRGDQIRGPCPLPGCCSSLLIGDDLKGKDRTFSIHVTKNVYRCFRCGSSGSVLDFWRTYRATTLHEAALELNRKTSNHP
jgi:hypothetical protein